MLGYSEIFYQDVPPSAFNSIYPHTHHMCCIPATTDLAFKIVLWLDLSYLARVGLP